MIPDCCILVLNYNGRRHLDECLKTALVAARNVSPPCPVVVVDNRSTEDDVAYVQRNYPDVEVVIADENDMLFSLNPIVARRTEEIVIILNNDMRFDPGFIPPLLRHFNDPEVFGVTARVFDWDGSRITTGKRSGHFKHYWFYRRWTFEVDRSCLTLDAGGGCAAFRRRMFTELGGFDRLYHPAYFEDTDLSYRAWKRGWKVIFEPASIMYHKVGATLNEQQGVSRTSRLICRNEVLFAVRNCGGSAFLSGYLVMLPIRWLRNRVGGHKPLALGIQDALPRLPQALWKRWLDRRQSVVDDERFLEEIETNSTPCYARP